MKAEESYQVNSHDEQGADFGEPGQRPRSSAVGKVVVGLVILVIVAGAVLFRALRRVCVPTRA